MHLLLHYVSGSLDHPPAVPRACFVLRRLTLSFVQCETPGVRERGSGLVCPG